MDLEELTLPYYLKVFSFTSIIFLFLFLFYIFSIFNKNLIFNTNPINIKKGENIETIFSKNINNLSNLDIRFFKLYLKIIYLDKNSFIHYGDFYFNNNASFLDFIAIITKPSNVLNKITIVEGWSKKELDIELSKNFKDYNSIEYSKIIADTYFIQQNIEFNSFVNQLQNIKIDYFTKYKNNKLFNKFDQNEILILGSLLEKEGLDTIDKRMISSVIFNRLKKNMKLQIDATVLFAITNGEYNLNRKLLFSDLKIDHPFNTYIYKGLPPQPISYVGKKTLDILFENYETDFLFYFYNKSLNKHIFSKTFKEHKQKLNDYRNKK